MGLDIRLPLGLLFAILGVLLMAFGLYSDPAIYARSLSINVNLVWGFVLLVFGSAFLFLGRRGSKATGPGSAPPPTKPGRGH